MMPTLAVEQSRLFSYMAAGTDAIKATSQIPDTILQQVL